MSVSRLSYFLLMTAVMSQVKAIEQCAIPMICGNTVKWTIYPTRETCDATDNMELKEIEDRVTHLYEDFPKLEMKLVKLKRQSTTPPKFTKTDDKFQTTDRTQTYLEPSFPENCSTVSYQNAKILNDSGGVFDISPESEDSSIEVYCDLKTDGGGWIVFQRRMTGDVSFNRIWEEYVNGFGEKDKDMWLGLETIHQLTKDGDCELRIDLGDFEGNYSFAKYSTFSISPADDNYRLTIGEYSGDAGDSMTDAMNLNNMQFTTTDSDNDELGDGNCAMAYNGGWWHKRCTKSNLNGIYYKDGRATSAGITWHSWKFDNSLKFVEMKLRKKN